MAEFRQALYETAMTGQLAALTLATSRVHLEPPDPYAEALEKMRQQQARRR